MKNDVQKKKKSSREKRVLIASLCIAAAVMAGSTFAWFTSKDEVTNRLSANASYDVSIAEDFTPPEEWVPGQTIDKNVGVVNTGNTDAFVRAWLEGEMRLLSQSTSALGTSSAPETTAVTDAKLIDLGLTYSNGTGANLVYLKELDNTKLINNPSTQNATSPNAYTEVMAVQAGGELAYAADNSSYQFTPNETLNVVSAKGAQIQLVKDTKYTVTVNSGATIANSDNMSLSGTTLTLKNLADFRNIDSNTFKPLSDGLYIFRRNADLGTTDDFEFSGYYVKTIGTGTDAKQHFFALEYDTSGTQRSNNVLSDTSITPTVAPDGSYTVNTTNVKLFTAKQETIENANLNWNYSAADNKLIVSKGNIKINIELDNIGTSAEQWTAITDTGKTTTFYYNNDLEEGATTSKLVDSVTMDSSVTQNDYIAFDFDLNVLMESVQVAMDANKNESFTTVTSWATAAGATYSDAAGGNGTITNGEIELIAWS